MPSTGDAGRSGAASERESSREREAVAAESATSSGGSLSRRRLLAVAGGGLLAGGVGGYTVGARPFEPPDCDAHPVPVEDDEWSFPNHDRRHTATAPASVAPESLTERWHARWDVSRHGPPAVANDTAFVAAVGGLTEDESLYAFDLSTGEERWRRSFPDAREAHPVVAAGERVYYHTNTEDRGRTALALGMVDGRERWADAVPNLHAYAPPLALADGRVLLDDPTVEDEGAAVTALDSETGERCWRTRLDVAALVPTPAVADGSIYYAARRDAEDGSGALVVLDAATGAVTRKRKMPPGADGPPVLGADLGYVATFDGPLVAFSLDSGDEVWRHERTSLFGSGDPGTRYAQPSYELGALTPTALVARLEAHTDASDRLRAFDPATGEVLWTRVAEGADASVTPPTAAGDAVFAAETRENDPNRLLRLDARTGQLRDAVAFDGWTHHAPVPTEAGVLFVTGRGVTLYR